MLAALSCMTSCVKYTDFAPTEFPQGKKQVDKRMVAQRHRRSTILYNEFETCAIFDALWLSDELRTAYVDLYGTRRGMSQDSQEAMLKMQLEENRHWITFVLLADVRDKSFVSLGDSGASWTAYAQVDGKKFIPAEKKDGVKEIELEPEIQQFFGKTYKPFTSFKTAYQIKIPVDKTLAEQIASGGINSLKLVVSSPYKEGVLEWTKRQLTIKTKVTGDEDFYWG
jgi:hypothetical protein